MLINLNSMESIMGTIERLLGVEGNAAYLHSWRGREIRVETEPDRAIWLDGEYAGRTPATMRVRPLSLCVVGPCGATTQTGSSIESDDRDMARIAFNFSAITNYLFISSLPETIHAEQISDLGVRLIVSMPIFPPPRVYRRPPFEFVHCPTIDSPLTPIPMSMLWRGVRAALPVIARGDKVLVHCAAGIHRSVAMASCILISQGETADDAMRLIKEQRPVADPYVGYIQARIRKFEQEWQAAQAEGPQVH